MPGSDRRRVRVLIVADAPALHAQLRALFAGRSAHGAAPEESFEADSAYGEPQARERLLSALDDGEPYAVAFVESRLAPGATGAAALQRLRQVDPRLQAVLITAGGDFEPPLTKIQDAAAALVLESPFDDLDAWQWARVLSERRRSSLQADAERAALTARIRELERAVERHARTEARLAHDALHDALTDLPNRALISDRIERALSACKRDPAYHMALAFLDLDDFKRVNDSLGHAAGDKLLVEVAARIVNCTRQTDCASRNLGNTTARLGGDEFLVLLDGLASPEDALYVAHRIRESIAQPLALEGRTLQVSASLGIAFGNSDYDDASALIRDADLALYRAKAAERAGVVVFDSELRREALARLRVESELRNAIASGQLFLQYQPILDLADLRIAGFESLVRWRHPVQGVIPPNEFVPIAEETGLILQLGAWVLRTACEQVADWRRRLPTAGMFVNVNFSTRQLTAPNFVDELLAALDASGLRRDELHVELTESLLLTGAGPAARAVQRLSEQRLELHLDDFGASLSSLAHLKRLPVSAIKLNRSFLRTSEGSRSNAPAIRAVIELAHAQGLRVVAEGVETAEQVALLQELGCDMAQGFYFAPPLDAEAVEHRLSTGGAAAA